MKPALPDRFWDRVEPVPLAGCLLWTGPVDHGGYGQIKIGGKRFMVHRLAYENMHGPIPDGLLVCHHCDVRCCVNGHHLFAGTGRDNTRDMLHKGRGPQQKLSVEQIRAIQQTTAPLAEVAGEYGVSLALVSLIRNRRKWGWIHANDNERTVEVPRPAR